MPPKKKQEEPEIQPEPVYETGSAEFKLDNCTYNGEWRADEADGIKKRHGFGVLITGKERYEGNWEDDAMCGEGVLTFPTGAVYKGSFRNNVFDGQGTYTFPDGSSYSGEWLNNKMHGHGVHTDVENRRAEGTFINGHLDTDLPVPSRKDADPDNDLHSGEGMGEEN